MNRELKFKAWSEEYKSWDTSRKMIWSHDISWHNFIFVQYTGLKDKSDTEIYEGDILRWQDDIGDRTAIWKTFTGTVTWDNNWCCFKLINKNEDVNKHLNNIGFSQYEIIGNIFENPEII